VKKAEYEFSKLPLPKKWIDVIRDKFFGALLELVDIEQGVDSKFWDLAIELDLEKKMRSLGVDNIAIQGEMCGPGIQGNKYNFDKKRLFVFQAYHTDAGMYLPLDEATEMVAQMELDFVPILDGSFVLDHTIDELVKMSEGKSVYNNKTEREGLVYRLHSMDTDYNLSDLNAGLVSFKVVSPKFLLKNDE
jgi:RNA ligase (TIGR02306 family)